MLLSYFLKPFVDYTFESVGFERMRRTMIKKFSDWIIISVYDFRNLRAWIYVKIDE